MREASACGTSPVVGARPPRRDAARVCAVQLVAVLLCGSMGAALAHVWVRLQQIQGGYDLSQATREEHQLAETQKRLRIEAAVLKHPARIERLARARLNMAAPEPQRIHLVRVPRGLAGRAAAAGGKPLAHAQAPAPTAPPAVAARTRPRMEQP